MSLLFFLHLLSPRQLSHFVFGFQLITSGAVDQREADTLTVDQIPDDDVHISDADLEDGAFLQPYSSRQRQALLQEAGVKRIDREEKKQLHALRFSREACGCDCRGFCEPETCACSLAGIKCQVQNSCLKENGTIFQLEPYFLLSTILEYHKYIFWETVFLRVPMFTKKVNLCGFIPKLNYIYI